MECSLALSMMSCRLLVCLVFGLAFQMAPVESFTTRMVRIFRGGGLVNNDDTGHGNIMKGFSLGRKKNQTFPGSHKKQTIYWIYHTSNFEQIFLN